MALALQRMVMRATESILPSTFQMRLAWDTYRRANACIALTEWEAQLMRDLFKAPAEKIHVVPNGVEEVFFASGAQQRGKWLVCTATITERKRVLELAEAAVRAQTPVWIIGRPYAENDSYPRIFQDFAAKHGEFVRYEGAVNDRDRLARIYRESRGFVLLSTMESLSISALEAAASRAPLLLSELPWARTVFGTAAQYCPIAGVDETAQRLKSFYETAPGIQMNFPVKSWADVAQQLRGVYERVLSSSR
jgi:phosphatidylinositol alpha-mannosyltransferase